MSDIEESLNRKSTPRMLYVYKAINDDIPSRKGSISMSQLHKGINKSRNSENKIVDHIVESPYKHALQIINDCTLYFPCPASFNDPFDFQIRPKDISVEEIIELINTLFSNDKEIDEVDFQLRYGEKKINDIIRNVLKQHAERIGACCMTPYNNNILMWSHYADSHRGICLGFDTTKDPEFFNDCVEMEYAKNYRLNTFEKKEFIEDLHRKKYEGWSYEKEYRLYRNKKGPYSFNPESLTEIIFGCRSNVCKQQRDDIIKAIHANEKLGHVKIYQARMNKTSYKLDISLYPNSMSII